MKPTQKLGSKRSACCAHHTVYWQVVQAHTESKTALDAKGITYHDLMKLGVSDNMNKECMLHRCKTCPSETGSESFVRELPPYREGYSGPMVLNHKDTCF